MRYLPYALNSVLEQNSEDFELIVSDNHSIDGTWQYLSSLKDSRVRAVKPDEPLSMARHFDFAIGQAIGEWITVLGDDDALQPYFFDLAEKLTLASPHPVISSPRAYYFWPGCEIFYSDSVVEYVASRKTYTRHSLSQLLRLLFYPGCYFAEPQFYTGTLFRNDMCQKIKERQDGVLFTTPIVDANSVALIFNQTPHYTYSHIPLAWVGSSPKSTGFAYSDAVEGSGESKKLVDDFDSLNRKDKVPTSSRFPFSAYIHNVDAYFLEAFFQVYSKSGSAWNMILKFKPAIYLLFGKIYSEYQKQTSPEMREAYEKTFAANGLNLRVLEVARRLISSIYTFDNRSQKSSQLRKTIFLRIFSRQKAGSPFPLEQGDQNPISDCNFSSNSRSEFPTILHASAKSKDLYEQKLS
jgi:glycosyltransferase involved in cell wall biosynthesis